MAATPDSPAADSPRASSIPRSDDEDAAQSVHGDDDAGEETKDQAATPETTEKPARGKGKTGKERDANSSHPIGKIRHLKKEDGEPLWREDIQFDFLKAVFDNEQKVFTNSYDPDGIGKQNFADIYIDTMSRSTKTSKVLRDKLLSDREAAKGMAMVCLLVNMGRMNTTLNFFPEMRAQLRTYHAIPSLQAHQDPHAYKQLQDAPRLKSILKGGAEDRQEPVTLDKIKEVGVPRTNPVNLIFVMCNAAAKVAELHFPTTGEFHDLIMKTNFTSHSRAMAFLWLMWFYLESDFTEEGCDENPFGPGVDYGLDVANQGVPELKQMTPEEKASENVDTPEEIEFGREKQKTRSKILEADQAYLIEREKRGGKMRPSYAADEGPAILPRIRPSKHESDMDSTRSTPPPRPMGRGGGQSTSRRGAPLKYQIFEGSSPARTVPEGIVGRKPRPPTAHQLAVERNRTQRVEYILDRGIRREHHKCRKLRRQDGAIFRAYKRVNAQTDPFDDSEGEDGTPRNLAYGHDNPGGPFREKGVSGFCVMTDEKDDFGEEVSAYAAALRRSSRRLARWAGRERELGIIAPTKRAKVNGEADKAKEKIVNGDSFEAGDETLLKAANGDMTLDDIEMEEADQTALGDDEDMDDPDRTEIMGDSDPE